MSNIERKYSYLDEGVFPQIGEYGVTYLTLYSSGAGNVYDGWMWDPDRVHSSETERTFGYRNPDYPDYCWDDEVVVDLSNAQTRQETSDFAQGRITSFNTNVSSRPIVLQDIDITGLDEEEREALATTVLFSAIPIVKDAYIQAMVEVQMKVNLSPTNTNGMVRVEAFYILNDESDRTMRPNPVHTFAVSTANERHTLPWLYWNPALKHEDNNYIGVKLLCTGGTAEIGISDDPEYGDAMITLTSAGLTGDYIDSGYPVSLDIYGKSIAPPKYKLKESDYTVLCTYDTGEVYEVTRLCEFTPPMGSKLIDPVTTLTANYQGLTASMSIVLAQLESIELVGLTDFYEDTYTLNRDDYIVMAYYDTGDIMDVTDDEELIFDPPMGTVINEDTTLTATYSPEYMHGSEFEDSLEIVKHTETAHDSNYENGLIYTLYDDGMVEITGNAKHLDSNNNIIRETIGLPNSIRLAITQQRPESYSLKWNANGEIGGITVSPMQYDTTTICLTKLINFDNVQLKPSIARFANTPTTDVNYIYISFNKEKCITSDMLMFLRNITYERVSNIPSGVMIYQRAFEGCESLTHLNFLSNMNTSYMTSLYQTFKDCILLNDISGIKNFDVSIVDDMRETFFNNTSLESASDLIGWNPENVTKADRMFMRSSLKSLAGPGSWRIGSNSTINNATFDSMFRNTKITNLIGINEDFFNGDGTEILTSSSSMFAECHDLISLDGSENLDTSNLSSIYSMFGECENLEDISAVSSWNLSNCENITLAFGSYKINDLSPLRNWDVTNVLSFVSNIVLSREDYDIIMRYSCPLLLWDSFVEGKDDSYSFIFDTFDNKKYLRVKEVSNIDGDTTPNMHYYIPYSGLFRGRAIFKSLYIEQGVRTCTFINPNATPQWYRDIISYYVTRDLIFGH